MNESENFSRTPWQSATDPTLRITDLGYLKRLFPETRNNLSVLYSTWYSPSPLYYKAQWKLSLPVWTHDQQIIWMSAHATNILVT